MSIIYVPLVRRRLRNSLVTTQKEGDDTMPKLVESSLSRIKVPKGKRDVIVFDTECPGFAIRKFSSGKASFPSDTATSALINHHAGELGD